MTTMTANPPIFELSGFDTLRRRWELLLFTGIAMVVMGVVAVGLSVFTTMASVVVLGALVFAAGIAQIVHAFSARGWSGVIMHLLLGVFYIVAGLIMMFQPAASAVSLTLFLGVFFLSIGAMRAVMAVVTRYPSWGWTLTSGLVTCILGFLVLRSLPASGLMLIGTFLGIDLIMGGAALTSLAFAARGVAREVSSRF